MKLVLVVLLGCCFIGQLVNVLNFGRILIGFFISQDEYPVGLQA